MLYGLEVINKPKLTPRIYFRFIEGENKSEVCINEKVFIDKVKIVAITKKEMKKEYSDTMAKILKKIDTLSDQDKAKALKEVKTEEFKSNTLKSAQNRLESLRKVRQGKDDFSIFINKVMKFAEETYKSIK